MALVECVIHTFEQKSPYFQNLSNGLQLLNGLISYTRPDIATEVSIINRYLYQTSKNEKLFHADTTEISVLWSRLDRDYEVDEA